MSLFPIRPIPFDNEVTYAVDRGGSVTGSDGEFRLRGEKPAEDAAAQKPGKPLVASIDCLKGAFGRQKPIPWDDAIPWNPIPWNAALTLAEISNATYSDKRAQDTFLRDLGATQVKPIANKSSLGIVASNDDVVVIAFRGTNGFADWLYDANILSRKDDDAGAAMHTGFYEATDLIFQNIYDEAILQGANKKVVCVTGHSLGGAMAVAFAYRAVKEKELVPAGIVTFGQPLLLNTKLAQFMLNTFASKYARYVNNWDIVTRLLPTYRHAGSRTHLTSDDSFTYLAPRIAVEAAPTNAPVGHDQNVFFMEEDEKLKTMTEDEFKNFQEELRREGAPKTLDGQVAVMGFLQWKFSHSIENYIERIKSIGSMNPK